MADLLPWQSSLWAQFAERQQHAHAYLLHGPAGIGKRQFAEHLRARLLCLLPQDGFACGRCKGCLLLAAGTHPDSFTLEPEEADKAIKVDQVRELVDFVVQTAQLGGRKVILLEPAEAMNINAANALLKSLEEPSGDTVLLLISHQPSRLLPTIKSRCVQQAFVQPGETQSLDWLASRLPTLAVEEHLLLLQLAGGSPLLAQRLQELGVQAFRGKVVEGIKALFKQQNTASQLAEQWNDVPLTLLFDWFSQWAHLILCYRLSGDEQLLGLPDMRRVLQYLADRCDAHKIIELQQWLLEQRQNVLHKANLNRLLLLEATLGRWASLPRPS